MMLRQVLDTCICLQVALYCKSTGSSVIAVSCANLSKGGFGNIIASLRYNYSIFKKLIILADDFC